MSYVGIFDIIKHCIFYIKCYKNHIKIKNAFNDKSIAIIGNADSLLSKQYGKAIDNHDIVIRINKGFIKNIEAQGSKTNVLATSIPLDEIVLLQEFSDANYYVWLTPKITNMKNYSKKITDNLIIYPLLNWLNLYRKLKTRPTSGMMLIDYIFKNINFSSLDIYGFDFFTSNSINNEISLENLHQTTPHNFNSEKELIEFFCKQNKIINLIT